MKSGHRLFPNYNAARDFQRKLYNNANRAVKVLTFGPERMPDGRYSVSYMTVRSRGVHPRNPKLDR